MAVDLGSIRQLLAARHPIELVTGAPTTVIKGVVGLLADDDVTHLAQAGDLVVILGPPPPPGWALDALLRRCADVGVAAVALRPGRIGKGSIAVAERLGLAIITARSGWDLSVAVHELLHSEIDTQIGSLVKALMKGLQGVGTDVAELLRRASAITGRPMLLFDPEGRGLFSPVAWPPRDQSALAPMLATSGVLLDTVLPSGQRLIARRVESVGRDVWLGVASPGGDQREAEVISSILAIVQFAVGQRLAALQMLHERDSRTRAALLNEIMEAGPEPPEDLRHRTMAAGWDIRGWHIGIRIIALGDGATISLRDDLLSAFTEQGLKLRAVEQRDGWIAWLSYPSEPEAGADAIGLAIRKAQRLFNAVLPTAVGVGGLAPSVTGLVKSIGQATDAARIAVNRPTSGHFVRIDRLGLAQLLLALTHTDIFTPAAKGLLDPLGPADGMLTTTLTAYLDAGGSGSEAAAILGIHRNTVALRLARIQELLSVDLDDPETRLALHLVSPAFNSL